MQLDQKGGLPGFYGNEELEERAVRARVRRLEEKEVKRGEREQKARRKAEREVEREVERGERGQEGGGRRDSIGRFFRRGSRDV